MLRTVRDFDPAKYVGDWYEIGSIPHSSQKDCVCTRARYSLNSPQELQILNTCNLRDPNGVSKRFQATARNFDPEQPGKLWIPLFWGLYWTQYRIVDLGANYDFAVVSDARGRRIWILSRTPEMDPELYSEILMKLWSQGIDIDQIRQTRQHDCSYP